MAGKKKRKSYKIWDADICMLCDITYETPKGNGIRPVICQKCYKKNKKRFTELNNTGIYLTPYKEIS